MTSIKQAIFSLCLCLFTLISFAESDNSIYQRYILIQNDLPYTIYPVVQAPDNNCNANSTRVNRIIVDAGLPPKKQTKIVLPSSCWYKAGRLYLFTVPIAAFEKDLDPTERTNAGIAEASYPLDSPAQLIEYTFDADDPKTGAPSPNPDSGIPMADIDVSYVDQAYLPVAIAVDDKGASGYLGTAMGYDDFNKKTANFLSLGWSSFAAFSPKNWENNVFHTLLKERSANIPAGYNLFQLISTKATSQLYKGSLSQNNAPSSKSPKCNAWSGCSDLSGDCCPVNGMYLACCGLEPKPDSNYIIDNTVINKGRISNSTVDKITDRWKMWLDPARDPCTDITKITVWPSNQSGFDKKSFCDAFSQTVKYVWNYFQKDANSCGPDIDKDHCVVKTILGYNSTVLEGRLPQSVQALLRSVPYVAEGSGPQYNIDKWLLFWAPYDSVFNLNPFTHYVHKDINAVAYSFSIDDKYGNFRTQGSGFIVDAGGDSALINKSRFDPYEQYYASWAQNWDHAEICGNPVAINALPGNARISFWSKGINQDHCDIKLFTKTGTFVLFRLKEKNWAVTDNYTGISGYTVHGLTWDQDYCLANSSKALVDICTQSNLSKVNEGDTAYLNVTEDLRPNVYLNIPPLPKVQPPSDGICTGRKASNGNVIPCCNPSLKQICPGQLACPICGTNNCECPSALP